MAGERGGTAAIVSQEDDHVLVSVPLVGFPPGFELRPGQRVVLVNEATGPAARPLVRYTVATLTPDELERGVFEIDEKQYMLQKTTITRHARHGAVADEQAAYVVWYVEPGSAEGPYQVVAVRPVRPEKRD